MSKYYIAVITFKDSLAHSANYRIVEGEPVTIKGFEDFDLFIHPSHSDSATWVISEGKTGYRLFTSDSRGKLLALAKRKLAKLGVGKLDSAIQEKLEHGHSPRYNDKGELDE
jgi:hypothetical protein